MDNEWTVSDKNGTILFRGTGQVQHRPSGPSDMELKFSEHSVTVSWAYTQDDLAGKNAINSAPLSSVLVKMTINGCTETYELPLIVRAVELQFTDKQLEFLAQNPEECVDLEVLSVSTETAVSWPEMDSGRPPLK
eukprot:TRINITY_DN58153_c0_g1_i1.p1 TRINITY_DN58153_c0_g1~~TRINITY_DN58153_c0_g1_i1.p1  ORF type:complete len:135 (+),score=7.15 TRINITY_DN58153_c0_g1_i1:86-490(+)